MMMVSGQQSDLQRSEINDLRQEALTQTFKDSVGRRVFLLITEFPFMIVGVIEKMAHDFLFIAVETTQITELEGKILRLHLDIVEVFFIEDGVNRIPEIK